MTTNYKPKDKTFNYTEIILSSLKYHGFFNTTKIIYHSFKCRFLPYLVKSNSYNFLNLKIEYFNKQSLVNMFYELFGSGQYYFKTNDKKPVIVDIGANIGDSLIYFKWLYPESRIFAYEPHPKAFSLLEKNVEINKFKDVYLFNEGLGNENANTELYDDSEGTFEASTIILGGFKSDLENKSNIKNVRLRKVSDCKELLSLKKISLLKIDIEGGESALFRDLDELLRKTEKVIMEFHLFPNNSFDSIINKLNACGFKPSIAGFYRNVVNYTNPLVFLIIGDK
jgi:FkbM family methyltransferase